MLFVGGLIFEEGETDRDGFPRLSTSLCNLITQGTEEISPVAGSIDSAYRLTEVHVV